MIPPLVWKTGSQGKNHSGEHVAASLHKRHPRIGLAVLATSNALHFAGRRAEVSQGLPGVGVERLPAAIPWLGRATRWLAALCVVASSAGCVLTQDVPDPALDIPDGYKAARLTSADAPPTLDWWRGFRSPELTTLTEPSALASLCTETAPMVDVPLMLIWNLDPMTREATWTAGRRKASQTVTAC